MKSIVDTLHRSVVIHGEVYYPGDKAEGESFSIEIVNITESSILYHYNIISNTNVFIDIEYNTSITTEWLPMKKIR